MATDHSTDRRNWTSSEIETLRAWYPEEGPKGVAARLGRTPPAVQRKAFLLGFRVQRAEPVCDGMKRCTKCSEIKVLAAFSIVRSRKQGKQWRSPCCKPCKKAMERDWKRRNPEKASAQYRRDNVKKRRLTQPRYEEMLEKQGGVCAICRKSQPFSGPGVSAWSLAIDHDHKTGKVRGLLCTHCNHLLGKAFDNVEILKAAITYLEDHQREV